MTRALAILCTVLAVATGALLAAWRHDHNRLAEARAAAEGQAEAERVARSSVIVAAKASRAEAEAQRRALEQESATFRTEAARQLAAAKGRIETLLKLRTGVLVAGGDGRPLGPPESPQGALQPPRTAQTCLLAAGDHGDVLARVSGVRYERGTLSVAGDAEAARIDSDGSRHVILAGPWAAAQSVALEAPREVVTQRARFAVLGGVAQPWRPTGGYGGAAVRIVGPLWVEALGVVDDGHALALAGARWELR